MTAIQFTNYSGNLTLRTLLRQSGLYLGILTVDCTPAGNLSAELVGGGYQRQPVGFTEPTTRASALATQILFSGLPESTGWGFAVFDEETLGNIIVPLQLDPAIVIPEGKQLKLAPGDIAFQL